MIDPFAEDPVAAPVEDTPTQPAQIVQEAPISANANNPLTVNVGNEGKIVATFKGGSGFDAPWLVVHATNVEELDALLSDWTKIGPVLDKVSKIGKAFAAEGGSSPAPSRSGGSAPQQGGAPGKPAGANQSPDGVVLQCQHGDRVYRNKVENGQVAWEAQFCPTPKGTVGQCKAIFKDRKKGWSS